MDTLFFKKLNDIGIKGKWTLHIDNTEDTMVLTVQYKAHPRGDKAARLIPPLTHRGTPGEVGSLFFEGLTRGISMQWNLECEMENFAKGLEEARKNSEMENRRKQEEQKEKSEKEKTKTAQERRYDTIMAQVDELEKAGKHREAWTKCPDPKDFPEKVEEIRKRREALSAVFEPSLFNNIA
ncbi:prtrc system protein e [Olivibacter jilunii]|uniref:prtrc system protein e n=1 Tax=Olivibacter jilunii TaxID=985016 RepID=UPI0010310E4A|nr:prtrc system protein e [Olivibacter jilunii]